MLMTEVTAEAFWEIIGAQDVVLSLDNEHKFPYTTLFKLRHGDIIGKLVNTYTDEIPHKLPLVTKYYLNESR